MRRLCILLSMSFLVILSGCAKKTGIDPAAAISNPPTNVSAEPVVGAPSTVTTEVAADSTLDQGITEGRFSLAGDLATVYFDFDSFTLTAEAREKLSHNAKWLKKNPSAQVTIEGHTDERGSDAYNLALGEKRALAAQDYLLNLGIPAEKIRIISYGEERPAVPGQGEDAWSKNRRAEFM